MTTETKVKSKKAATGKSKARSKKSNKPKLVASKPDGKLKLNGKPAPAPDVPTGPLPAPKDGPNLTLRARSLTQIERIKRAARKSGCSMNTWAVEVLNRAAEATIG